MSRRGGNVRRLSEKKLARVQNNPETLLRLLKTVPGIFGSLSNFQVSSLAPALIFPEGEGFKAYYDPAITSTNPMAHQALAKSAGIPGRNVRSFIVFGETKHLFPRTEDVKRVVEPEDAKLEEKLATLRDAFMGRAAVEIGGLEVDGAAVDLATLTSAASQILLDSYNSNLGLDAAKSRLAQLTSIKETQG